MRGGPRCPCSGATKMGVTTRPPRRACAALPRHRGGRHRPPPAVRREAASRCRRAGCAPRRRQRAATPPRTREEERRSSRHERGRVRRPASRAQAGDAAADDVLAGCAQRDVVAVAREARAHAVVAGGSDGDHLRKRGGVIALRAAAVPARGDEHAAVAPGVGDDVGLRLGASSSTSCSDVPKLRFRTTAPRSTQTLKPALMFASAPTPAARVECRRARPPARGPAPSATTQRRRAGDPSR